MNNEKPTFDEYVASRKNWWTRYKYRAKAKKMSVIEIFFWDWGCIPFLLITVGFTVILILKGIF